MIKPSPLRWQALIWMLLAWSPALAILALISPLRVPIPFEDSWAFVEQYKAWWDGSYGWREFFAPHNNHPSAVGKTIYFIVLHWLGGDVALLPLLSWVFSLAISVAIAFLLPLWPDQPARRALLLLCANLTIFTAAQGHSWIWDFIFQNFIPGTAFCVALAWLWKRPGSWLALAGAAILCLASTFSFGTGLLAGVLLVPMVWLHFPGTPALRRAAVTAVWLMVMAAGAWTALKAFGEATSTGEGSRVGTLLEEPFLLTRFVLLLLGYIIGNGSTMEPGVLCPLMGLGLVMLLGAACFRLWQLRHEPGVFRACLPGLLIALLGAGNAALIGYGRLRYSLIAGMAPRYVTFTLFFALGVLMLVAAVVAHDRPAGWFRLGMRRLGLPLAGAFIAMHSINWNHGWQHMRWEHERMLEDRAMLSFVKVLTLDQEVMWQHYDGRDETGLLARFLAEKGRLRSVRMLDSTLVSTFRMASPLPDKWAWFDPPAVKDGQVLLEGACGMSKDTISLPDLIAITAQTQGGAEAIVNFAVPRLPFDFYENEWLRRQHLSHYFGWTRILPTTRLPSGRVTLRAYGCQPSSRQLRPLTGEHTLDLP